MTQSQPSDRHLAEEITRLSNAQVCAMALWILGGATRPQDLEDVTAKCFELAPSRFKWKKHDYPNLETAWAAMRHDGRHGDSQLMKGSIKIGWLLTAQGITWAQSKLTLLLPEERSRTGMALRQQESTALASLESHRVYKAWQKKEDRISVYEIADAVQLTADAPKQKVIQRINELNNMDDILSPSSK